MNVCNQRYAPAAFLSGKGPVTHCKEGWMGTRTGLGGCEKSRPRLGFDSRTISSVASRYTDYAIPAHGLEVQKEIG